MPASAVFSYTAAAAQPADYETDGAAWASASSSADSSQTVSYYYPRDVGDHHFGERHPMKPYRLTLTNHLVFGYGLHHRMQIYQPQIASKDELEAFHDEDYIDFLSRVTPDNVRSFANVLTRFNIGDDCPIFDNMYEYVRLYAGSTLSAARKLASGTTDIAVSWAGGLHHAKKFEASGFCYINDIVLGILELLRVHPRVLYIDIDIHHGDGVQEAFYNSNRVLTVSFHKYSENFFPGTGHMDELGDQLGKYFSLNVPLQDGIDNESYVSLFKAVMEPVIHTFRPSSIVLQCGADSLGCDRLGCFNLSVAAHGECVRFIKSFHLPLLVLGGGGYTIKNVARCWTYETAVLVGAQSEITNALPQTRFDAFFAPDYKLHPPLTGKVENLNTRRALERIRVGILERLRFMHGAPSVAMDEIPPDLATWLAEDEDVRAKEGGVGDDERGAGGGGREVGPRDRRELYDGDRDQDAATAARPASVSRRGSGRGGAKGMKGGRPAGKKKTKSRAASMLAAEADAYEPDDDALPPTLPAVRESPQSPQPPPDPDDDMDVA